MIARGASVAISDIDERNLSLAKASLPSAATTLLDVRNSKAVTRWIDATIERFGRLDGAANLAGVSGIGGLVQDEADDLWDLVVGVNAKGVYNCLRAQIPRISDGGSIVSFCFPRADVLGTSFSLELGECRQCRWTGGHCARGILYC